TAGNDEVVRKKIAAQSVIVAFFITVLFCLLGKQIFSLFGITLPAFKIAGGLLVTSIGFQMLQGESSRVQKPSLKAHEASLESELSVAVSPLGIPLLSGPGTITTGINFASTGGTIELLITIVAFALLCFITFVCFIFSKQIKKYMGQTGLNVVTRLMGLILAVIGVQMLTAGLKGSFPFLAG
ncbi:MAG: MarC family protein, partial [Pseudomonadota bacterium]